MAGISYSSLKCQRRGRRLICVLLCIVMLALGTLPASAASVYSDVSEDQPLAAVIDKVSSEGLFEGSGGRFKANRPFTRAMMSKVMQRLLKGQIKAPAGKPLFEDVPEGAWYQDSSFVMVFLGILNPAQDPLFHPDQQITREDFARFLYVYVRYEGLEGSNSYEVMNLPDLRDMDPACRDAAGWALSAGVLRTFGDGSFAPKGLMSRGDAALAFSRYLALMEQ